MTVVAGPTDADLAVAIGQAADRPADWYGLGRRDLGRLLIVVVRGQAAFDTIARGRLPSWGAGLTVPGARFVVIRADGGDPFQVLRHELAHVALHQAVSGRVPLWFDEGYAVVAAGEWGRLEGLRLNLTVASGDIPGFNALDAALRGSHATAEAAYALAGSAVMALARKNPTQSLEPLFERLADREPFGDAVTATTGLTLDRFEERWQKDVKSQFGLILWLLAGGGWVLVAVTLLLTGRWRKRRDAPRRAALDIGWPVAEEDVGEDDAKEGPVLDHDANRP